MERFGERMVATSSAFVATLGCVLTSFATNVFHLYLTYSIILGVGMGISYVAFMIALGRYFNKKRGLATGIAVCGCGVGSLIFPPVIQALENHYGWRGAMLILSGILLNSVVCGAIVRPFRTRAEVVTTSGASKDENEAPLQAPHPSKDENEAPLQAPHPTAAVNPSLCLPFFSLARNVKFICLCAAMALFRLSNTVITIHLADYAMSLAVTKENSALLYSLFGGSVTVFRFLSGAATQLPKVDSLPLCIVATLLLGVITTIAPQFKSWAGLAVYACLLGAFASPLNALTLPNTAAIVDTNELATAFGVSCFFDGFGAVFGGPLSGNNYPLVGGLPLYLTQRNLNSLGDLITVVSVTGTLCQSSKC